MPILHLFRPKQIANDIWRASDPELGRDAGTWWRGREVPALFAWWWAAWLVSNFLYNAGFRLFRGGEEPSRLIAANVVTTAGDVVAALSGLLAFMVVKRTTERQEARAGKLESQQDAPAEPRPATDA